MVLDIHSRWKDIKKKKERMGTIVSVVREEIGVLRQEILGKLHRLMLKRLNREGFFTERLTSKLRLGIWKMHSYEKSNGNNRKSICKRSQARKSRVFEEIQRVSVRNNDQRWAERTLQRLEQVKLCRPCWGSLDFILTALKSH